ncbi:MAG: phage GP46 family protein [Oscillospiraceae bacterium]|nr:phage GP46 family protein [Oscillospiraceae bacterium]
MEPRIKNGDYIPDGLGGVVRCEGAEALLERVLFRLIARRGGLPFLPRLGSRLYLLSREPSTQRLSAAQQYVAEALAEEPVSVTNVELTALGGGQAQLTVLLDYQGRELSLSVAV